jgi:osmotically-inducible protein OsmY
MKTLIATLLATAAGASFAAAPTAALNHDPATYRNVNQKALIDYRTAVAKCDSMSANDKNACMAEARTTLAKSRCDAKSGADKDSCVNSVKPVHTVSSATAVDKCAQAGGDTKTGCLVETKPSAVRDGAAEVANRTGNAAENAADNTRAAASTAASKTRDAAATAAEKTKAVAATAAEKTKEVAHTAVEKTKQAASTLAQKSETAMDRAGADTRQAASTAARKTDNALDRAGADTRQAAAVTADKTSDATAKTQVAASDTAITAKVKAGLVNVPNLDSLGVHVETEKGVVMLSGFVDSKAQADQAVQVAKGVDGVSSVKSAIKVK